MKSIYRLSQKDMNYLGVGFVLVTISLTQLFGATSAISSRFTDQTNSIKTQVLSATNAVDSNDQSFVPTHITIKKVQIDLPVVSVALNHGTWMVNEGVANYAVETSKVSKNPGNVGIYAHDKTNGFTRIKELKTGDQIDVSGGKNKAIYIVKTVQVIDPKNVKAFYPTENSSLTLLTCDGIFSQQRYIVKAELLTIKTTK